MPLKTVDAMEVRRYSPGYFEMLSHPSYDEYWKTFDIEARHRQFEVPACHFTGWYDTLLNGTLRNFTGLRRNAGTERARSGQRLVVGPWTHSSPTPQSTRIGDVDFGPKARSFVAPTRPFFMMRKGPRGWSSQSCLADTAARTPPGLGRIRT